jgi:hypothetical protein
VVGVSCLECGEPAAEAGELIRRQLGHSVGDFFYFHVAQYSTAETWLSDRKGRRYDKPAQRLRFNLLTVLLAADLELVLSRIDGTKSRLSAYFRPVLTLAVQWHRRTHSLKMIQIREMDMN